MFAERLKPTVKTWTHDRSKSVGASEIGACARQTWFRKNGVAEEREIPWGFGERGLHIEKWVYSKIRLRHKQRTIFLGHLSATIDGMSGKTVVDIKSFDPWKKEVVEPKHLMQVQVQIALTGAKRGVLLYINASNFQDAREVIVEPDYAVANACEERAKWILATKEPPPREGHLAGGKECQWCPFQTVCLGAPIEDRGKLNEADTASVATAVMSIKQAETTLADAEGRIRAFKEQIREILRAADAKRAPGLARISRSQRTTLDQDAMARAGIDLAPYRKPGRETEQVTVE